MNGSDILVKSSAKRKSFKPVRRLFFLMTTLWGYILGVSAAFIIAKRGGASLDPDFFVYAILIGSIVLAVIGAIIFHSVYRQYRKRKSIV